MVFETQSYLHIPEDVHKAIVYSINVENDLKNIDAEKIDKRFVHKGLVENVLITDPVVLDKSKNIYRTKILADSSHKFFFDHELAHLPGMLLLEAARQFGTAISHLFFNAPFDSQFILHDLGAQFVAGANADENVYIDVMIINAKNKKGELRKMTGIGYVHQNGEIIGKITSAWSIIPKDVINHLSKFH